MDGNKSEFLTLKEAAQFAGVVTRTVQRWAADRKVKCYRTPSGGLRLRRADILRAQDQYEYNPPESMSHDPAMG